MKVLRGIVAVVAALACVFAGAYALYALTRGDWVGVLAGIAVVVVLLFYVAPRFGTTDSGGSQQ